jgi:hypothetical protein
MPGSYAYFASTAILTFSGCVTASQTRQNKGIGGNLHYKLHLQDRR